MRAALLALAGCAAMLPAVSAQDATSNADAINVLQETQLGIVRDVDLLSTTVRVLRDETEETVDLIWLLLSALLIFFMQTGFLLREGGTVRAKNLHTNLTKNVLTPAITGIIYWIYGYGLAFGSDYGGFLGASKFALTGGAKMEKFFFQWALASASSTIVSGAVAGRMQFRSYVIFTVLTAGLIYPIVVHWVWGGGFLATSATPVLDFAGSGVVHLVGGVAALVSAVMSGARAGRFKGYKFNVEDNPDFEPRNVLFTSAGTIILWLGSYAIHGGAARAIFGDASELVKLTIVNTTIAVSAAALTATAFVYQSSGGHRVNLTLILRAMNTGMVAIAAGCAVVEPWAAAIIGILAAMCYLFSRFILIQLMVDDALDAAPIHATGGFLGLAAVGIFGNGARWAAAGYDASAGSFTGQLIGVLFIGLWTAGTSAIILYALRTYGVLRVPTSIERVGLDSYYHSRKTNMLKRAPTARTLARMDDAFDEEAPQEIYLDDSGEQDDAPGCCELTHNGCCMYVTGQMLEVPPPPTRDQLSQAMLPDFWLYFWHYRPRWVAFLLPAVVHLFWWAIYTAVEGSVIGLFTDRWWMAVTMTVGSLVNGGTSEASGALGFPVATMIQNIGPVVARDAVLLTQCIGTTSAAFSILYLRVRIVKNAIIWASLGGLVGSLIGVTLITPALPSNFHIAIFSGAFLAYAATMGVFCVYAPKKVYHDIQDWEGAHWKKAALVFAGFVGGVFTAVSGSGIDIALFGVLTLLFRVGFSTATPTTVVIMAINTVFTSIFTLAVGGPQPEGINLWLTCVPFVALTAPLGTFLASYVPRLVYIFAVFVTHIAQLVLLVVQNSADGAVLAAAAITAIFGIVFTIGMAQTGHREMKDREATLFREKTMRRNEMRLNAIELAAMESAKARAEEEAAAAAAGAEESKEEEEEEESKEEESKGAKAE